MSITEIWSRLAPGHLAAADFAGDEILLGDEKGLLLAVSLTGEILSRRSVPAPVSDVSATANGLVAVAAGDGEVVLFEGKKTVFRRAPGPAVRMVELGPHGDYLLALSPEGEGVFLNRFGREMGRITVPGGALAAKIVSRTGQVVAVSADGSVQGFASWGKPLWRAETGPTPTGLDCDESGELILVPIVAYGVDSFTSGGRSTGAYDIGEPVKAAACSGDGERLLLATSDDRLALLRRDATVIASERLASPIESVGMSADGQLGIVLTGSGYAHLFALSDGSESPYLEFAETSGSAREPWVLRKRVFSPFSLVVRPRIAFAPDSSRLATAGDRSRVQVLDLDGDRLALRRYGGSLLDLRVEESGVVRVFATRSVFRFEPDDVGSTPEWVGEDDLAFLCVSPAGFAIGLTENGELLGFAPEGGTAPRLFSIHPPDAAGLAVAPDSIAVSRKPGRLDVYRPDGTRLAEHGPWPVAPRLLAASKEGYLVGIGRLLVLLSLEGEERFRHHLSHAPDRGVPLPGAFLVADEGGDAWCVTATGVIRPAFRAGRGRIVPFSDAGAGPGFLLAEGRLLAAVEPNGAPRWRFKAPDEITFVSASPDGRFAAAFAGVDLFVFPLVDRSDPADGPAEAARFLEFTDG